MGFFLFFFLGGEQKEDVEVDAGAFATFFCV